MEIKTVKDYYEQMCEMFPEVPKSDIKLILNQGWRNLYMYNSSGADTIIKDKNFWCYIGYLKKNSLDYFSYYIKKLSTKLRILYKRYKIKWDGYYYFALTKEKYEEFCPNNKRGRPKKNRVFKNIVLYKILDECKVYESGSTHIFRVPYFSDFGFKYFLDELKTDKAELIIEREPLKFKDILINDNEYEYL